MRFHGSSASPRYRGPDYTAGELADEKIDSRTLLGAAYQCWTAMSHSSGLSQSPYRQNGTRGAAHDLLRRRAE
jgi:hypothetical protein